MEEPPSSADENDTPRLVIDTDTEGTQPESEAEDTNKTVHKLTKTGTFGKEDEKAMADLEASLKMFDSVVNNDKADQNSTETVQLSTNDAKPPRTASMIPKLATQTSDQVKSRGLTSVAKQFQHVTIAPNPTTTVTNKNPAASISRRHLSVEEENKITKDWQNVGVQRCPVCKFSTDDVVLFKNHTTTCTPPKLPDTQGPVSLSCEGALFKCNTCMIYWKNKAEFAEHVVCHIIDDPYVCITCNKRFGSRVLIEKHARIDHPNGDSKCGLKGIKKGRVYMESLEKEGKFSFIGKLSVPKTPRNQIKPTESGPSNSDSSGKATSAIKPKPTPIVAPSVSTGNLNKLNATTDIRESTIATVTESSVKLNLTSDVVTQPVNTDELNKLNPSAEVVLSSEELGNLNSTATGEQHQSNQITLTTSAEQITTQTTPVQISKPTKLTEETVNPSILIIEPSKQASPVLQTKQPLNIKQVHDEAPPVSIIIHHKGATASNVLQAKSVYGVPLLATQPSSVNTQESSSPLFGRFEKDIKTLVPMTIPNKIQKIVNTSTSFPTTTLAPGLTQSVSMQYQIKNFKEFSSPTVTPITTSTTTTSTIVGTQPLMLVPVGPIIPAPHSNILLPLGMSQTVPGTSTSTFGINQTRLAFAPGTPSNPLAAPVAPPANILQINRPRLVSQTDTVILPRGHMIASNPQGQFIAILSSNQTITAPPIANVQSVTETVTAQAEKQLSPANRSRTVLPVPGNITPVSISPVTKASPTLVSALNQDIPKYPPPKYHTVVKQQPTTPPNPAVENRQAQLARLPKKFLFRIKPGQGFVCEACRKFTKDEYVYRRHVWDHFHSIPLACKSCQPANILRKDVLSCQLINNIVCNLVKRSSQLGLGKAVGNEQNDVISISDDDEDENNTVKDNVTEVIVVDDDDDDDNEQDNQGLKIKITSTYSLTDTDVNLEIMTTKEDEGGNKSFTEQSSEPQIGPTDRPLTESSSETTVKDEQSLIESSNETTVKDENIDEENKISDDECPMDMECDSVHSEEENEFINKSLTEPEKDTEQIVSKAVNHMLNTTDNRHRHIPTDQENVSNSTNETSPDIPMAVDYTTLSNKKEDTNGESNKVERTIFENETLEQKSQHAFYMCGYEHCSFSCLSSQKYRDHLKTKHLNEYNYVCCHCGQKDYTEDSHVRHLFTHANAKVFLLYTCPVRLCKFKTNLLHMYGEHLKCHKSDELTIKCVYCHKIFTSVENLISHLKQNLLKFVNCPYCSFRFVHKHTVTKHIHLSHPEKPRMISVTSQVVCLEREINFYVSPLAKSSNQSAILPTEIIPYSENIDIGELMDEVQKEKESLKEPESLKAVSEKSLNDNQTDDIEPMNDEERNRKMPTLVPEQVKQKLSSNSTPPIKISTAGGPRSFKCPCCSFLSHNHAFHAQHISLHEKEPDREKKFICNLCPKGIDNLAQFKKHVVNHIGRNEIKIFFCTSCSYQTNQKCHIMDHCSENHDGKGKYIQKMEVVISSETSCSYCEFKARQAEHVVQHEDIVHKVKVSNPEKVTDPELTDKTESSIESMKKRKYHCEYCKNFFKHKANLKEHMETNHLDIENKQFISYKCKYCSYTSTMKDVIVNHMSKEHNGLTPRIMRKIENVESKKDITEQVRIETEVIYIPDGNIFKHPFKCPKCNFTNNLRINVMRHIKTHPELTPTRDPQPVLEKTTSRKTARKSTGPSSPTKKQSSLIQAVEQTKNPFASVKEAADEYEREENNEKYVLGENKLHVKLSSCFIPLESGMKFKCRICQQKIAKKFVLHRHILDHLNIVFFKCKYCESGTIEKTLLFGHIQKDHSQKPILFDEISTSELDFQFKEKIFNQNFNDIVDLYEDDRSESSSGVAEQSGIVKTAVHENKASFDKTETDLSTKECLNCPHCRYVAFRKRFLLQHLDYHKDPTKCFTCSICDFRSDRVNVIKHVYKNHPKRSAKVLKNGQPVTNEDSNSENKKTDMINTNLKVKRGESVESSTSSQDRDAFIVSSSKGTKINTDTLTKTKSGIYEMRTIFKCKDCGLKRDSRSSLYTHFNSGKCKRPFFQCSECSFQSAFKSDIIKHSKIRHTGKKCSIQSMPMAAKIKVIKYPVKQDISVMQVEEQNTKSAKELSKDKISEPSTSSELKCQLCTRYKGESVIKLQFHINTMHGGKPLYCQECGYKTPLVKHMINHCTNLHAQKQPKYKLDFQVSSPKNKSIAQNECDESSADESTDDFTFKCPKCDLKYSEVRLLQNHLYSEYNYKPYTCKYCEKSMQSVATVRKHIKNVHFGNVDHFSLDNDEVMETRINKVLDHFKRAKERHENFSGKNRPKSLDKIEMVEEGIRREGTKESLMYYCDFCGYSSTKKSQVKKHYEFRHPQILKRKRLDDSESESPIRKAPKLDKHASKVAATTLVVESSDTEEDKSDEDAPLKYQVALDADGMRMFKCVQCEYKNIKKKSLRNHMTKHTASTSRFFKCCYCVYTTKLITNAYRHTESMHKGEPVQVLNKKTNQVVTRLETGNTKPQLHNYGNSPIKSSGSTSGTDFYSPFKPIKRKSILIYCCNICDTETEGLYHYRQHLATHSQFKYLSRGTDIESKLACGYCSYMATNELDFSSHISSHLGERPFKCAYCHLYSDYSKSKVISHTKNMHPDEQAIVIDRDNMPGKTAQVMLVNFDPKVALKRIETSDFDNNVSVVTDESSPNDSYEAEVVSNLHIGLVDNSNTNVKDPPASNAEISKYINEDTSNINTSIQIGLDKLVDQGSDKKHGFDKLVDQGSAKNHECKLELKNNSTEESHLNRLKDNGNIKENMDTDDQNIESNEENHDIDEQTGTTLANCDIVADKEGCVNPDIDLHIKEHCLIEGQSENDYEKLSKDDKDIVQNLQETELEIENSKSNNKTVAKESFNAFELEVNVNNKANYDEKKTLSERNTDDENNESIMKNESEELKKIAINSTDISQKMCKESIDVEMETSTENITSIESVNNFNQDCVSTDTQPFMVSEVDVEKENSTFVEKSDELLEKVDIITEGNIETSVCDEIEKRQESSETENIFEQFNYRPNIQEGNTSNVNQKLTEKAAEVSDNVFEKFSSLSEHNSFANETEEKDDRGLFEKFANTNTDSDVGTESAQKHIESTAQGDNIFDKFTQKHSLNGENDLQDKEDEKQIENREICSSPRNDKNIFETMASEHSEIMEETLKKQAETEAHSNQENINAETKDEEYENIFDKLQKEENISVKYIEKKEIEEDKKLDSNKTVKDIAASKTDEVNHTDNGVEEMETDYCREEAENDQISEEVRINNKNSEQIKTDNKTLEEKEADKPNEEIETDKTSEEMELDDLIETLENTVQENEAEISKSQENNTVDIMDDTS